MESKIVYENDDTNEEIMPIDNKKSIFKNSSIEGSGSESLLNSIHSQPQEINHSSLSSLNAIGKSNNSNNNSNNKSNNNSNNKSNNNSDNNSNNNSNNVNNKLNLTNDQSLSFNISVNSQNNNNSNHSEFIDSKLSNINNLDFGDSKDGISSINNLINGNKTNIVDYSIISNNNIINSKGSINKNESNEGKKEEKLKDKNKSNSSKGKEYSDRRLNDIFKIEVREKMKQGFIPFFIKAKGYNPVFYYGEPNSKLRTVIEHYIKKINGSNEIKNNFYYNKKLIDLDSTIQQIKIKPLSLISNEIK